MELRVLNYFLMVAREENMTRASQLLHVTQPTLSRQIAQLEEELGIKLFTRSNHNINLTEDGMLLKRRAEELLTLADKTKRDFIHSEETLTGEITIGSGEFQNTRFLSQIIALCRKRYPQLRYRVYSGDADNIRERIERGLLDFGLVLEPIDIRKYDFLSAPMKERWGIWVRTDSILAKKETVGPKDLVGIPLIASANEFALSELGKWFGEYYRQLDIVATGNLLYNEAMFAKDGIGTVLGIELDCSYDYLHFIPLSPALESSSVLIWKKDQIYSPAATAFLEIAKKYKKDITDNNN
ncbi:LysR family transcriptional regulator [Lachnotalea sp. AF33-28]|jgi:DNA-binding transcriptional LysR family regulator|uniref:LysR family transcriptional regulator n=1 Tax=Lachnotalea sp. AF33-28 TaxID=2292046 RepID=UPI000E473BEC|nr:LysR family transcriptional regulator [Lachnotalea sp. AF33-28]RHP29706.1 LysR family transcriptional regulator [Lachnotalea sp. AF33-28]